MYSGRELEPREGGCSNIRKKQRLLPFTGERFRHVARDESFQLLAALVEWLFQQQVAAIQNIKCHVDDRRLFAHFGRDLFASKTLLERGEGERAIFARAPGQDFAVQNYRLIETREAF